MTTLTQLDWQPVILLKVVQRPFGAFGQLSLQRAYLAYHIGRLLYADWTLEAAERVEPLVFPTGWIFPEQPPLPFRLQGRIGKRIPAGTWVLPYSDSLYSLYADSSAALTAIVHQIDQRPTDPLTLAILLRIADLL